ERAGRRAPRGPARRGASAFLPASRQGGRRVSSRNPAHDSSGRRGCQPCYARRVRVAVVPPKDFGTAKQRLARALPGAAGPALARAMLEDVLAALAGGGLDRILVVTPDAAAAALAERNGATVLVERESEGHTA